MADVRAFRSGNWSDTTATSPWWNGTAIFAPAAGDNVYANTFTITVDVSVNLGASSTITTNSATSRVWKDGGTATASQNLTTTTGYILSNGITLTANITSNGQSVGSVLLSGINNATIVGNITGGSNSGGSYYSVLNSTTGTLTVTGNVTGGVGSSTAWGIGNTSTGSVNVTGNVSGNVANGITNTSTGTVNITGNVTAGATAAGATNSYTGAFTIIGDITATNGANGFTSSNTSATNRLSGWFINSANGTAAVYAAKYILNSTPLNARTRYALNGISTYVDMFTADNSLAQANPTDVRTGVSYASGALTGTLTVPAEGSISLNVTVGPLMPFTATRSSTTATATLAYSYPYTSGDKIVVTGASNAEWNGTYTIASVISGTSITFVVPVTYSSTAGTGAQMQTVGTAVLTAANIFDTLTSTMTTSGSIGERLANASTIAVTGQQITSALG